MSQIYGKTRWKRFAVVMVPALAATAAVGMSVAQGALAASFSVSGSQFKVSAASLHGDGFTQYGTVETFEGGKTLPVAVSGFNDATIHNLCQSVSLPFGFVLKITAGDDPNNPVKATSLYIDMTDLQAKTAQFNGINIGVAEGAVSKGTVSSGDSNSKYYDPTGFAQEADSADLTGVQQTAWATSAATFSLNGMHLSLNDSNSECF
ncbi:DUF6230 family protein [Streptacidiphilus sp. P02-A3a]|uniref:DUF6230 family protein n=1 Tax=Streptacidiphilus sp. P02-A3a TaxID=2704468 RepID=UPI0015F989F8|nr:DUF6230 family protein [Streptacidiphilus sp. P02-A3a]QMU72494.1 cholesterol esterase [Streptacidiphilus sp. P02-A3a]